MNSTFPIPAYTPAPSFDDGLSRNPINTIRQFLESDNVYAALIGERDYQDKKWRSSPNGYPDRHEPEAFLVYIEHYVNETKALLAKNRFADVRTQVQDAFRKIGALAIAEMEQHGVVSRRLEQTLPAETTLEETARKITVAPRRSGH